MKASNLVSRVWSFIKDGEDKQQLIAIYSLLVLATIVVLFFYEPFTTIDITTYFSAGDVILNGELDVLRTPVYPLICKFAEMLYPQQPYSILVLIHLFVFYVSVYYLYRLCGLVVHSRAIRFVTVLFYACSPNFILWTKAMLTESLSVSLLIIFCYSIIQSCKIARIQYVIANFLLLTVLVFMRPIFIFLVPILLLFWLLCYIKRKPNRTVTIINLTCIFAFVCIYFSYCKAYENKFGFFSTSCVSGENNYDILANNDLLDPNIIKDSKMRADVKAWVVAYKDSVIFDIWHDAEKTMIIRQYGRMAFQEYVDNNIKEHFPKYVALTALRFGDLIDTSAVKANFKAKNDVTKIVTACINRIILGISFRGVYLLLVVSGVLFVVLGVRQRKIPLVSFLFWLIVVANVFAAVVGAQAEYARLVLPCMPMLMIIAAMMIDMITVKIKGDYKVQ